jgi:hypothetical protein
VEQGPIKTDKRRIETFALYLSKIPFYFFKTILFFIEILFQVVQFHSLLFYIDLLFDNLSMIHFIPGPYKFQFRVETPPFFVVGCDQKTQNKVNCSDDWGGGDVSILLKKSCCLKNYLIRIIAFCVSQINEGTGQLQNLRTHLETGKAGSRKVLENTNVAPLQLQLSAPGLVLDKIQSCTGTDQKNLCQNESHDDGSL